MNFLHWNVRGCFQGSWLFTDKLASVGHSVQGSVWLFAPPNELKVDLFRDGCGVPNYRFP